MQNASKHGGPAVAITVVLREHADELSFRVIDDGPGFDPSNAPSGVGLQNMRDRLGALDGRLSIVTAPGEGTTVAGSVPVDAPAPDASRTLRKPPDEEQYGESRVTAT